MQPVTSLQFGTTTVEIWPNSTRIVYPDEIAIPGSPEDTDSYRACAARLGYGADTLKMCKDHETMHIALSHWLGIESPTMKLLRLGDDDTLHSINRLEEDAILALQRFACAAGVDLLARMAELQA